MIASIAESPGINVKVPHPARVYDYWLGGKDNARSCRAFLCRVVRYLTAEAGIRQSLDLGSGLPSVQNVHEVAQAIAPESRVVYVTAAPEITRIG